MSLLYARRRWAVLTVLVLALALVPIPPLAARPAYAATAVPGDPLTGSGAVTRSVLTAADLTSGAATGNVTNDAFALPATAIEHANDPPPDLPRLRTLATWLAMSLEHVRRTIADTERLEAEHRYGHEHRPPAPDWLIEMGLGGRDPVYVHVGGCHMAGKRSRGVDRDQAPRAVAEGIGACPHYRPDTELGVLDRRSPPGLEEGRTPGGSLRDPHATELATACVARPFE